MFIRVEFLRLIPWRNRGDLAVLQRDAEISEYLAFGGDGDDPIGVQNRVEIGHGTSISGERSIACSGRLNRLNERAKNSPRGSVFGIFYRTIRGPQRPVHHP